MNDAERRWGPAALAACVLVGSFAAFGPVMGADAVDRGPSRWVAAGIGAALAGTAAWLAWPRLRRLAVLQDWGRLVVVAVVAAIGALTAAAVATGLDDGGELIEETVVVEEPADAGSGRSAVAPPDDAEGQRWNDVGGIEGYLALGVALVMLVAAAVFFGRQSERRAVPASPTLLRSHLTVEGADDDPTTDELAVALDRTRAALLVDDDPRTAVRRAYRQLLVELDAIGLRRRNYEAPVEYLTRCLGDRDLPAEPLRELTSVFELARFSAHRIDRSHVDLAERCLAEATSSLAATSPSHRRQRTGA